MKKVFTLFIIALSTFYFGYSQDKPNIIIILADDLGYADVGFNGSTDLPTPNIDRIANNGVKFTNGYTSYVVCGPSRAGLMTGRYQQRFGFERNPQYQVNDPNMGLPQTEKTLATVLNTNGYTSGIVGKWHLGAHMSNHPLNRGFDFFYGHLGGGHRYFPEDLTIEDSYSINNEEDSYFSWILRNHTPEETDEYLTDEFSNEAVQFIQNNQSDPFFLFLSYNAPHSPLQASQEYLDRFDHLPDSSRKTYMAMVSAVDDGVGAVLDKLEELNLDDDTIVFFLSDNGGPETKNHSDNGILRGGKSDVYEGGYRVPFAMQWKGTVAPDVYDIPVSALDIFATAVGVSNTSVDQDRPLDGVNIIPYLNGENTEEPHEILYMRKFDQQKFAVRKGDFKLIRNFSNNNTSLYNLDTDISETTNIAGANPEIVAELEELREAWNIELMDPLFLGITSQSIPYEIGFEDLWNDDFEGFANGRNLLNHTTPKYYSDNAAWQAIKDDGNGFLDSNKYAQSSNNANVDFYRNHTLNIGETYTFKVATKIINEATASNRTHKIRITSGAHVYKEEIITAPDQNTWTPIELDITVTAGNTNVKFEVFREHAGGNVLVDNFSIAKKYNNLLNGDFEHGNLSGWNTWNNGITDTPSEVDQGNWSGTINSGVTGSLQQEIHLKSNTDYQVRFSIKSENTGESVRLITKHANTHFIGPTTINTTTNYTNHAYNFSTGNLTQKSRISIWKNNAAFGTQYVDNFEVVEVGVSPAQVRFSSETFDNIEVGIPIEITYEKMPAPTNLGTAIWSITNGTGTATVDQNGIIEPLTAGTATVELNFTNFPGISATYEFTINDRTAKSIFVDADYGSDTNDGKSASTPWKTIAKINNLQLLPGDEILFKSGQEFFGKLIPSASGVDGNPIKIGSYGGSDRPTINGRNYLAAIDASGLEYINFENLILKNDSNEDNAALEIGADDKRYGFYAHVKYSGIKKNISLNNIKIHKIYPVNPTGSENSDSYKGYGIYFTSDGSGNWNFFDGISITNCEITDTGNVGISINKWIPDANPPSNQYHKNVSVINNNLHHIGGSGIVYFNVEDFLIEQNTFTYTGDFSLDTRQHGRGSGFWSVRCNDGIIQHNEFSHARGPADSCGAHIDIDNHNIIIQYNLSYDNSGGFAEYMGASTNCIYRYNVSINDGFRVKHIDGATQVSNPEMYSPNGEKNTQSGKTIWFSNFTGFDGEPRVGATLNHVYNNTIYVGNNITARIVSGESAHDNTVKNNVFYVDGTILFEEEDLGWTPETPGINNVFDTNLWFGSGTFPNISLETLYNNAQNEIFSQDPFLSNPGGTTPEDYKIVDGGSPLINSGISITNNGTLDYFGSTLSNIDIGFHEYLGVLNNENETIEESNLYVYPNPAKNTITFNKSINNENYKIFNIQGQLLKVGNTNGTISIKEIPTGMYVLQLESGNNIKFIKI
ncbi:hypothetical protein KH5_15900 [Urechidicola sp. KH5]